MRKSPTGQLQASGSRQKPADNGSQSIRRSQPISRSAFIPNIDLPPTHQRIKEEASWRTSDSDDASSAVDAQADRRQRAPCFAAPIPRGRQAMGEFESCLILT